MLPGIAKIHIASIHHSKHFHFLYTLQAITHMSNATESQHSLIKLIFLAFDG